MQDMFFRLNLHRAGLKKRFVSIDNGKTMFCYCEKGTKVENQSSIVFIHRFSGDKYSWINIIKVSNYLCIVGRDKYLLINRIFLIVFIVFQLICLVMEKVMDLMKNN